MVGFSDRPFNIKGYVCLSFSILWGLAAVFVLNIIHPAMGSLILIFNHVIGNIFLVVLLAYFLADFMVTLLGILNMNKRFLILHEMNEEHKKYSNHLGGNIHGVMKTKDVVSQKIRESKGEIERDLEDMSPTMTLEQEYQKFIKNKPYIQKRIERAYPNIIEKIAQLEKSRQDESTKGDLVKWCRLEKKVVSSLYN